MQFVKLLLHPASKDNLYKDTKSTYELKLNIDGTSIHDETFKTSDFIPVSPHISYIWHTEGEPLEFPRIIFYTAEKEYIEGKLYDSTHLLHFKVEEGIAYIRVAAPVEEQWIIEREQIT